MCGRYSLTTPEEALRRLFDYTGPPRNLAPRYNIAPSQDVPALRPNGAVGRELVMLRWGLVPSWAKELAIGNRMINARAETVAEKPSFRDPFKYRRCLIAADGFYEWRRENGRKQPYRITRADAAPFAFAGLWERWAGPGGPIESCTIITTDANAALAPIHHRMPVILDGEDFAGWLDTEATPAAQARELLRPYHGAPLAAYKVGPRVNNPRHDDAACIEPAADDAPTP